MQRILVCLLIVVSSLAAQTRAKRPPTAAKKETAPTRQSFPLAAIKIEGNKKFETRKIIAATGLVLNRPAEPKDFEAARTRLTETGAFESIAYRYQPLGSGYEVVFEVRESQQLYPYRFEGLEGDQAKMRAELSKVDPFFTTEIPAYQPVLDRYAAALQKVIGGPTPIVARVEGDANEKLVIVFRPSTLPAVAEVKFVGNELIDQRTLQKAVAGAAVGSIYTETRFRQILDSSIRPLYEEKGRLALAFPKLGTEPAKGVKGLAVTVTVVEGPEYKLDEVLLQGAEPELLKEGKFKTGEPANFTEIQEGIRRMEQAMKRGGFMRVQSTSERKVDDKRKDVDVIVKIQPGPRYTFGKLTIQGLDIQTEPHIRKLWTLKSGSPFNVDYPDYFLSRIKSDGVMDNLGDTKSDIKLDDKAHIADVTLIFKPEKRPEQPRRQP